MTKVFELLIINLISRRGRTRTLTDITLTSVLETDTLTIEVTRLFCPGYKPRACSPPMYLSI